MFCILLVLMYLSSLHLVARQLIVVVASKLIICNCLMFFAGKAWKRMVTKVTFVGDGFTRKPPKYERFIRPMVNKFSFICESLITFVNCADDEASSCSVQ